MSVASPHLCASQNDYKFITVHFNNFQTYLYIKHQWVWRFGSQGRASSRTSLSCSLSLLILEDLPVAAELPPHLLHQNMNMLAAMDYEKVSTFISSWASSSTSPPPWRFDGRQEWRRVGSPGRRAHPAAPWTPVSSGPWSTWKRNLTRWNLCWILIDKIYICLFLSSSLSCLASLKVSKNWGLPLKSWGFKFSSYLMSS